MDSGAEVTTTGDMTIIHDFSYSNPDSVVLAGPDGSSYPVVGTGVLHILVNDTTNQILKTPVYYSPNLKNTLLSTAALAQQGLFFQERTTGAYLVQGEQGPDIALQRVGKLALLPHSRLLQKHSINSVQGSCIDPHHILGHVNNADLLSSFKHKIIEATDADIAAVQAPEHCDACQRGKATRSAAVRHSRDPYAPSQPMDTIHSDIIGSITFQGKKWWILTLIDEKTHFSSIKILNTTANILPHIEGYIAYVERQFGYTVKNFYSDQGSEYTSAEVKEFFRSKGIQQRFSTKHSPKSNGLAERFNYTLLNDIRTMLQGGNLSSYFWKEAAFYSTYIRNRVYRRDLQDSPYHFLTQKTVKLTDFHIFGERVYVTDLPYGAKTKNRGIPGIFLAPSDAVYGYLVYVPELKRTVQTRHVSFSKSLFFTDFNPQYEAGLKVLEDALGYYDPTQRPNSDDSCLVVPQHNLIVDHGDNMDIVPPTGHISDEYESGNDLELAPTNEPLPESEDIANYTDSVPEEPLPTSSLEDPLPCPTSVPIPSNLRMDLVGEKSDIIITDKPISSRLSKRTRPYRVTKDTNRGKSYKVNFVSFTLNNLQTTDKLPDHQPLTPAEKEVARRTELLAHEENGTWHPQPIPYDKITPEMRSRCVNTNWIFTRKPSGLVKGRLVARGDQQQENTYTATFSPTLSHDALRAVIAVAAKRKYDFLQLDIATAYLNANLDDDVYIVSPLHYGKERPLLHLRKSLYGLRQSGRNWFLHLRSHLLDRGYVHSPSCSGVYKKQVNGHTIGLVAIFVDDILIVSHDTESMAADITNFFKTKILPPTILSDGTEQYNLLGYEICKSDDKIKLTKQAYTASLAEEYLSSSLTTRRTPLPSTFTFEPEDNPLSLPADELASKTHTLRQIVGSLLYLATSTRPDLLFAVQAIARFVLYPHEYVLKTAYHVLQYACCTPTFGLTYKRSEDTMPQENGTDDHLITFTDASYGDGQQGKSHIGSMIYYNGGLVYWKSSLTSMVCLSSTEAEVHAIIEGLNGALYMKKAVEFISDRTLKLSIFTDNQSAIKMFATEKPTPRNKHYSIRFDKIKAELADNRFSLRYVCTADQVADILTKPVTGTVCTRLTPLIQGIQPLEDIISF